MTNEHPLHNAFDRNLPVYLDALYAGLKDVSKRANELFRDGHDCNCEFCDQQDDGEVPPADQPQYNSLRDEALEIADTIRRCIRWAKFKKIELREKEYLINLYVPEEL